MNKETAFEKLQKLQILQKQVSRIELYHRLKKFLDEGFYMDDNSYFMAVKKIIQKIEEDEEINQYLN